MHAPVLYLSSKEGVVEEALHECDRVNQLDQVQVFVYLQLAHLVHLEQLVTLFTAAQLFAKYWLKDLMQEQDHLVEGL